ncbi:hypothetical protein ACE1CI_01690 [Aerosakkonemataceae cyanobacterium BLCC-F50]|uniref:Sigma-70 family RNA polymerase sigma factor n=1 Tax=Floridaenema flaviceps BLCC-F50 TaxID=3153642 RepID=A0ABV4XK69_9CYAN
MDDSSLCRLIREALSDGNRAAALALAIDQLPKIKAYLGNGWLPYYEEALPVTMRDVERNINRFPGMYRLNLATTDCQNTSEAANVREHFIKWVVMILTADCKDVKRRRDKQPYPVGMGDPIGGEGLTVEDTIADDITLSGIKLILERERRSLARQMRRYIEEDPEKRLRNCHPRNNANLDCQLLSQKLLLEEPPLNPRQVAKGLTTPEKNIPEQTVYDRWRNYCLPLLRIIARELGYED